MSIKCVVIGDAHIDEKQNLERFTALRSKLDVEKPDYLIIIGDFLSMNCLSDWDRNKRKKMEGLRYHLEIAAGKKALSMLGIDGTQPFIVIYIEGNHEDRLTRYLDTDPTFEGMHSIVQDLELDKRKVKFVPYKVPYEINGVSFVHIPAAGNGKAIGNPNVCQKALRLFANSVVFGHTHTLDHAAEHRHGAPHLNQALCVGCFFEHVDDYAKGSKTDYWRGIVDLTIYSPNRFDFSTTSMRQLYTLYGNKKSNKQSRKASHATARTARPR